MVAYACDPAGGGEHWLGWGWAAEVSKEYDVVLFTTSGGSEPLKSACAAHGIELHCIDVPPWIRWLSGFPPGWGAWLRKIWWQSMVLNAARKIHFAIPFDLVHQTTFHTFRVPFACAKLGIPSVWGPVAGGESVPSGFEKYLGAAARAEKRRSLLNNLTLCLPWVGQSLQNASCIIVSNRTTLRFFPVSVQEKCVVISPNALRDEEVPDIFSEQEQPLAFQILFVGNCAPTRAMPLVFEALSVDFPIPWKLKVVGGGAALDFWRAEASRLGIDDNVEFTGPIPRDQLERVYRNSSVLVFPALRDSGGSALLEAMTLGLPILTFDWAGPGEMVDAESAILVNPLTPSQTVHDVRQGLLKLAGNPDFASALGKKAHERAVSQFRWRAKVKMVSDIYANLLR